MPKATSAVWSFCLFRKRDLDVHHFQPPSSLLTFAEFVLKTELKWFWTGNFPSDGNIICYESVDGFPVLNFRVYFSLQIGGEKGFFD